MSAAPKYSDTPWSLPQVVDFFSKERNKQEDLYPSEWNLLQNELKENISILDIGCAQGGFAQIISTKLKSFQYTGVDLSQTMIDKAKKSFPQHHFICGNLVTHPSLLEKKFDLVFCFGVLHLVSDWRELITQAWKRTAQTLIFDVRETTEKTVEDIQKSFFRMNWNGGDQVHRDEKLPYIILNTNEALQEIQKATQGSIQTEQYGYFHKPRGSASIPYSEIITKSYKVKRTNT